VNSTSRAIFYWPWSSPSPITGKDQNAHQQGNIVWSPSRQYQIPLVFQRPIAVECKQPVNRFNPVPIAWLNATSIWWQFCVNHISFLFSIRTTAEQQLDENKLVLVLLCVSFYQLFLQQWVQWVNYVQGYKMDTSIRLQKSMQLMKWTINNHAELTAVRAIYNPVAAGWGKWHQFGRHLTGCSMWRTNKHH